MPGQPSHMHVEVLDEPAVLAQRAAGIVCDLVREKPNAVLGLPTGATPIGLYAGLAHRANESDFSNVAAFAIDELHGVPRTHPATNASYFRDHRVPGLDVKVLDSETADPEAECARLARGIADVGGLDLVVLGIGRNGHLAFNEPGSSFDSRSRRVALERATRETYAPRFGSLDATPAFGLTLGMVDLLAARHVLLLAIGAGKAEVVAAALEGPVTEQLPASVLQRHHDVTVLLARVAAAKLAR